MFVISRAAPLDVSDREDADILARVYLQLHRARH